MSAPLRAPVKERYVRPKTTLVSTIIEEVAAKHGLTYFDMVSSRRDRPLCTARQEAYYRCAKETLLSYTTIGSLFGGRDHSTVMKGAHTHIRRLAGITTKKLLPAAGE